MILIDYRQQMTDNRQETPDDRAANFQPKRDKN